MFILYFGFAMPVLAKGESYTCVHKGLEIETEGFKSTDKDKFFNALDNKVLDVMSKVNLPSFVSNYNSASLKGKKELASSILGYIDKFAFSDHKKNFDGGDANTLCEAFCTDKNGCFSFDCDASSFIYMAVLEKAFGVEKLPVVLLDCPAPFIKSEHIYYGHMLLRWKLPDSSYINWETTSGKESSPKDSVEENNDCREVKLCSKEFYAFFYANRGEAKKSQKKYKEAMSDYNKAIEMSPYYTRIYSRRGITKYMLEDYVGAIDDYNKYIKLKSNNAEAYVNRGMAKYQLGYYESAMEDYNTAMDLDSEKIEAYIDAALAEEKIGNYAAVSNNLSMAIKLNPNNAETYNNRGYAKYKSGKYKYEDILLDYKKSIELDSSNAYVYFYRGYTEYDYGYYKEAIGDLSKAIQLDPKNEEVGKAQSLVKAAKQKLLNK